MAASSWIPASLTVHILSMVRTLSHHRLVVSPTMLIMHLVQIVSTDTSGPAKASRTSFHHFFHECCLKFLLVVEFTAKQGVLSEPEINAHLRGEVLAPILNKAWEKAGIECRLRLEPRQMSSGQKSEVDGVYYKKDALLPRFPGTAPSGCVRSYYLPGGVVGAQPDAAGPSEQLQSAAAVAAAGGSSQAHQRQPQPGPEVAGQSCDSQLRTLAAALEDFADGQGRNGRDFMQSARLLQQQVPTRENGHVRIGFMGEGKLEGILTGAIDSSIPQLWRNSDTVIRSVVRQVCLQNYVDCICERRSASNPRCLVA